MGQLTPSKNEIDLLQRMFEEKVRLIGEKGYYYEVKDHKVDKLSHYDEMQYFDPIEINFIFEEMPNPKTLKNLNWWDDSDETTPPIAYLPWHRDEDKQYLLKPSVGSKIEIRDPLSGFSRFYEIQEINANSYYLIYSIVKLTPCREEKRLESKPAQELGEKGTKYEFISE